MNGKQVLIIGSGNIAWHLGWAINRSSYTLAQIVSRNRDTGVQLAKELQCHYEEQVKKVKNTQFVIIAVSDSSLVSVVDNTHFEDTIVMHTAGSIPMSIFNGQAKRYGVLYPYQTLTKGIPADFNKVPLCIEASDKNTLDEIELIAQELSSITRKINSEQRKILHLAGIIANNFTNHLVMRAGELLDKYQIDQELLQPLLYETINKLEKTTAYNAQTGPARRNETNIIKSHLEQLDDMPELKNLYRSISDSIIALYSKEKNE